MLDYDGFRREQAAAREQGRYLGIGVSTWGEICGLGPSSLLPGIGIHGSWNTLVMGTTGGGWVPVPFLGLLLATIYSAVRWMPDTPVFVPRRAAAFRFILLCAERHYLISFYPRIRYHSTSCTSKP